MCVHIYICVCKAKNVSLMNFVILIIDLTGCVGIIAPSLWNNNTRAPETIFDIHTIVFSTLSGGHPGARINYARRTNDVRVLIIIIVSQPRPHISAHGRDGDGEHIFIFIFLFFFFLKQKA